MKRLIILLAGLYLAVGLNAQTKDEKEVADAVETLRKAMVDADKAALDNITASELSYGHSSGVIEDKAAFMEALTTGKSDFVSMDITDQKIRIAGPNAIVRHKLNGTTNNNGTPGTLNLNVLLVWQKQKGQWKLLARQAVRPPN